MDETQNEIIEQIKAAYGNGTETEQEESEDTGELDSNANELWQAATGESLEYTEADAELQRLQAKWGPGPDNHEYNEKAYNRLEEIYNAYAAEWPDRGKQTELSLIKICRLTLEQERALAARNWDSMKAIQGLIKAKLDVEAARKKEAAMRESIRIDDIVSAVEKAGLHMMDYDELCTELANHAMHRTYPYTRDAADRMLLLIRNATAGDGLRSNPSPQRGNEGVPGVADLPDNLKITDELGEFARVADSTEQKLMAEL